MRGLRLTDACKGSQVHAVSPIDRTAESRTKLDNRKQNRSSTAAETPSHSLFVSKLGEPPIEPFLKFEDYVKTLGEIYAEIEAASDEDKSRLYLEQSFVFQGLGETKLVRRNLRSARQFATTVHEKLVYSAWLKYERRDEELAATSPLHCTGRALECPQAARIPGFAPHLAFDPCSCSSTCRLSEPGTGNSPSFVDDCDDVIFHIGNESVMCNRQRISFLSEPFTAMLYGCFTESRISEIDFTHNGISVEGMRAVADFSETGRLDHYPAHVVLELLTFANRFCCEKMKSACDTNLAALVRSLQDAVLFMDYALEENAPVLVSVCLQHFLWDLPESLQHPFVASLFCKTEGKQSLLMAGHSSSALYLLLSQVAFDVDMESDLSVCLLRCLLEVTFSCRQKALALHKLGCVMLARKEYRECQGWFEASAKEGHIYSLAGLARAKFKRGHRLSSYKDATSLVSSYKATGWMYQEMSLYCDGSEKLTDLLLATQLDPTLTYPYKYRAAALMDEQKVHAAITEINRVLGFKVTSDCLEMRVYFCLALPDYEGALRDLRTLLTLEPNYMMYSGRVAAEKILRLLNEHAEQWTKADCWMQLYDRWSSVDDIGSLAVVHQMLESEPAKGLLRFRQSLLLLRLNCPKAAMRSLRLARKYASSEQERLVYEGWILYDTGHREEALQKSEESISIQRSFEAFFLKAYALADTSLDNTSSAKVVDLLEEALKCPSDGLRKGQALNNLGSVFVDCGKLDLAADCYVSALKIRHTRAHQGLARVNYLKNDRKAAYEEMSKLIEKARSNASAYEKRSEYCDRDMAKADLSMASQLDPLRTYPYRYRAAVLMDDHMESEAIAELSKAIAFKADVQLLHLRAAFYESIGDMTSAVRDCRAALSMDPKHSDALDLYDRVWFKSRD